MQNFSFGNTYLQTAFPFSFWNGNMFQMNFFDSNPFYNCNVPYIFNNYNYNYGYDTNFSIFNTPYNYDNFGTFGTFGSYNYPAISNGVSNPRRVSKPKSKATQRTAAQQQVSQISRTQSRSQGSKHNPYMSSSNKRRATIQYAESFIGKINSNEQGNARFSPTHSETYKKYMREGRKWHWCVDFINTIVKDVYGSNIKFNKSSSALGLKKWGEENGIYTDISNSPDRIRAASRIKAGDLLVLDHHACIVKSVNNDGTITTIDGNSRHNVEQRTRKLSNSRILGYISMDRFT